MLKHVLVTLNTLTLNIHAGRAQANVILNIHSHVLLNVQSLGARGVVVTQMV
jgi:hypothetical protein